MTKVGDRVRCPECDGKARVIWVSKDGRAAAVRCPGHHRHMSTSDKRTRKRGMVFLVASQRS